MWVKHCFKDKYDYYYNLETGRGLWEEPEGFEHSGGQLSKDEIQVRPAVLHVISLTLLHSNGGFLNCIIIYIDNILTLEVFPENQNLPPFFF